MSYTPDKKINFSSILYYELVVVSIFIIKT